MVQNKTRNNKDLEITYAQSINLVKIVKKNHALTWQAEEEIFRVTLCKESAYSKSKQIHGVKEYGGEFLLKTYMATDLTT